MSYDYTTTGLLASIKRRAMLPDTAEALASSDYLAMADDEMQTYIVPLMMRLSEEYFVTSKDVAIVASTSSYVLPERAIGGKLRDLLFVDGSSNVYSIPRLERESLDFTPGRETSAGVPQGYYFQGTDVVLYPTPSNASGSLRFVYFQRPNRLVATTDIIDTLAAGDTIGASTISLDTTPLTSGAKYDIIENVAPFRAALDITASSTSGLPTGTTAYSWIATGCYICEQYESPVAQLPPDIFALLAQRVAFKALEALGDPKAVVAKGVCDEMAASLSSIMSPRNEGSSRAMVNHYGPGWSRRRGG
jgi:hypothetical protein